MAGLGFLDFQWAFLSTMRCVSGDGARGSEVTGTTGYIATGMYSVIFKYPGTKVTACSCARTPLRPQAELTINRTCLLATELIHKDRRASAIMLFFSENRSSRVSGSSVVTTTRKRARAPCVPVAKYAIMITSLRIALGEINERRAMLVRVPLQDLAIPILVASSARVRTTAPRGIPITNNTSGMVRPVTLLSFFAR